MRGIWIRRLLPASVVSVVLAFSYFAPAFGVNPPPVNDAGHTNCGRFGYGYHGGKHDFVCPSPPAPPPAVQKAGPLAKNPTPAPSSGGSSASQPAPGPSNTPITNSVIDVAVPVGASQWRAFIELVLRELS